MVAEIMLKYLKWLLLFLRYEIIMKPLLHPWVIHYVILRMKNTSFKTCYIARQLHNIEAGFRFRNTYQFH